MDVANFDYFVLFLKGNYYQTVWDDFNNDIQIWNLWKRKTTNEHRELLMQQVKDVLKMNDESILLLFDQNSVGGLCFDNSQEARAWLQDLYEFIK